MSKLCKKFGPFPCDAVKNGEHCEGFVCYRQWAGDVGDCFCGITKNDAEAKKKNADCPLVPVPDYVDAIFSTNYTETITTGENREKTEENCGY